MQTSGELDCFIEIIAMGKDRDSAGGLIPQAKVIGQAWAALKPVSANTFQQAGTLGSALVANFIIRDLDFEMRPDYLIRDVDKNMVYKVEGVLPVREDHKQRCLCSYGELADGIFTEG